MIIFINCLIFEFFKFSIYYFFNEFNKKKKNFQKKNKFN